jgi:hypothetical protein
MAESPDPQLIEARELIESLLQLRPSLSGSKVSAALRDALGSAERQWALYLLLLADADLVSELLPELLIAGLRSRDALLVRQVVGRLSRNVLQPQLSSVIRHRLPNADDEEFRRMAELLRHLGLEAELQELVAVAKDSDDSNIREVAADFAL